jgi:hypothetical protein
MRAESNLPQLGESASTLGVRVPKDIKRDAQGNVTPDGKHGMSVRPSVEAYMDEASAFVPRRYKDRDPINFRNAAGNNNLVAFRIGDGTFVRATVNERLNLTPDRADHGIIEPARTMPLEDYRNSVAATRTQWIPDEP